MSAPSDSIVAMPAQDDSFPGGSAALVPTVAWGRPSDECVLFESPMRMRSGEETSPPADGRIRLLFRDGTSLEWAVRVDDDDAQAQRAWSFHGNDTPSTLLFEHHGHQEQLAVCMTGDARGFVPGDREWAQSCPPLASIRATLFGLSHLLDGQSVPVGDGGDDVSRHQVKSGDWLITFDERPDHAEVLREAERERYPVATHVLDLRRGDNTAFSASEGADTLTGLMFGLSFAMDRWVPPVLAQGLDASGSVVATQWAPLLIDSANRGSQRWWNDHRTEDFDLFLPLWLKAWANTAERSTRGFLLSSALAAGEGAFVEQRLSTRLAALELLRNFVDAQPDITDIPRGCAGDGTKAKRLRGLLVAANIGTDIPQHCPKLLSFAAHLHAGSGAAEAPDGPAIVTYIRNRLAHPEDTDVLYRQSGLIAEAERLSGRYLDMALLWELGYHGHVRDRTRTRGWAGESEPTPWLTDSAPATLPTEAPSEAGGTPVADGSAAEANP